MLDELIKIIECLKKRIREHKEQIQGYESRTRTALIDPVLRSLGWDVSDPSLVTIEPRGPKGWADYALLDDKGKTVVFVEAKRLSDTNVPVNQIVAYAVAENIQNNAKIRYCASTNGDIWELYDIMEQKLILRTSIMWEETAKCAQQLLGLRQLSMADGLHGEAVQPVVSIHRPNSVLTTAGSGPRDAMLDKAIELASIHSQISTGLLQRRLRIGYPRAARLMDQLEDEGIISREVVAPSSPPKRRTASKAAFAPKASRTPQASQPPKSVKPPDGHEIVSKSWKDTIFKRLLGFINHVI